MGSDLLMFIGHVCPGVILITLGTWWGFNAWRGHFVSRIRGHPYLGTASFTLRGTRSTISVDGLIMIAAGGIGTARFACLAISDGHITNTSQAQHMSIFMFYALSGILDTLTARRLPLPEGTDYAGLMMNFAVQGLLIHFHLHDRSPMDALVHTLFVYCTVATAVCVAIEMAFRQSVLATLGRAFFAILQGTWSIQIAFILHSSWCGGHSWKDDHQGLMLVVAVYTWHMFGIVVYLGFVGGLTRLLMLG
ncbi:unnamed protein product, partial [Ixodes hexagonus]